MDFHWDISPLLKWGYIYIPTSNWWLWAQFASEISMEEEVKTTRSVLGN